MTSVCVSNQNNCWSTLVQQISWHCSIFHTDLYLLNPSHQYICWNGWLSCSQLYSVPFLISIMYLPYLAVYEVHCVLWICTNRNLLCFRCNRHNSTFSMLSTFTPLRQRCNAMYNHLMWLRCRWDNSDIYAWCIIYKKRLIFMNVWDSICLYQYLCFNYHSILISCLCLICKYKYLYYTTVVL